MLLQHALNSPPLALEDLSTLVQQVCTAPRALKHHNLGLRRMASPYLALEDLAVLVQQVGALHAWATRLGANHQRPVGVAKDLVGVGADRHLCRGKKRWGR